ncbi:hypothetical protein C8F01DRAFT_993744, partial [Mycena amicta]
EKMPSIAEIRTSNATYAPSYLPTVIFFGGTSGIGRATAEAFARHTHRNARIIIVGRNASVAQQVLDGLPKPSLNKASPPNSDSGWKHEFISCDASLIRNVHALIPRLPSKVNFLAMTAGYFSLGGRIETEEGLDLKMALTYYARSALVKGLLPALRAARDAGENASILSVLGAGHGHKVDLSDLGLVKGFTGMNAMDACATYTDLIFEEFSARNPSIALTHTFPQSPVLNTVHWAARLAAPLIKVAFHFAKSMQDAGETQLYALLPAAATPGTVHRRSSDGEQLLKAPVYGVGRNDASRAVWEHTMEVLVLTGREAGKVNLNAGKKISGGSIQNDQGTFAGLG